jgi:hypothetical protein
MGYAYLLAESSAEEARSETTLRIIILNLRSGTSRQLACPSSAKPNPFSLTKKKEGRPDLSLPPLNYSRDGLITNGYGRRYALHDHHHRYYRASPLA